MKKQKAKNYAFIDSQNLYLGVKSQGWELDFARFGKYLEDKHKVSKAFLFIGYVQENQRLYTYLQKAGFICIFKPTLEYRKGKKIKRKGNVDAELVLHAMIEFPNYKQAVVVSGDGDFHCLIEHLEIKGKLLKIIVPNEKYSSFLRQFAPYIVNINLLRGKLRKRKKNK